jgi:hypothetical protein
MICSSASWRSEQPAQLLRDDCHAVAAPEWPFAVVATAQASHVDGCGGARAAMVARESPSAIRPSPHRICGGTRSCDRIFKIFFRPVRTRGNRPASLSRRSRKQFARARTARRRSAMVLRSPCATRLSCTRCEALRVRACGRDACSRLRTGRELRPQRRSAVPRDCPPFVKWSRCFLRCAVVIGVQCSSIRECTVP